MNRAMAALLMLVASASLGLAQANTVDTPPCSDAWCVNKQFTYRFCDQFGRMIEKCSADPNNDPEFNPPLRPAKKATPLCLTHNLNSIEFNQIIIDPSTSTNPGRNVVVFDLFDVIGLIREVEREWTWLCPAQGPNPEYAYCCLMVKFSDPGTDFGRQADAKENTRAFVYDPPMDFVGDPGYCRTNCQASELVINTEREFTRPDENGVPTVFFFTRNLAELRGLRPDLKYVSMRSILLHEMGHWLGLGHASGFDDLGRYCGSSGSIMEEGYVGEWNQVERRLTQEDKCAFMKLYCCARTADKLDVDESPAEDFTFDPVPNPARRDRVTLRLSEKLRRHVSMVRLLNSAGEVALQRPAGRSDGEITLEVADLPDGAYFVQIIYDTGILGGKIVIQR